MITKQNSSLFGSGKLTAEFTQGQLVIGSCAMLFIALLCFVIGMITGRGQASKEIEVLQKASGGGAIQTAAAPKTGTSDSTDKKPTTTPAKDQGVQTSPRPDSLGQTSPAKPLTPVPATPSATPPVAEAAKTPASTPATPATPPATTPLSPATPPATPAAATPAPAPAAPTGDKTVLPPLPPIPKTASEIQRSMQTGHPAVAQPTTPPVQVVPLPGATAPGATVPPTPVTPALAPPTQAPAPATPVPATPPAATTPAPTATPAPAAKPVTVAKGKFGIQVASFQGAEKEKTAAECQRRLKANAGFDSVIVSGKDGAAAQVVIPGFKDRLSAKKAVEDLKKKPDFKDAWVKELQ